MSEYLFDSIMSLKIIDCMKQLKAILELLPRKALAVMFACLFMLQGMGMFHAAVAANVKFQEISFGSNIISPNTESKPFVSVGI